ncbi:RUFY3 isoform X1 [Sigmodon hispidus]
MAESPPPGAAAESCEDPERGGERRAEETEEPRGATARGTDREDEAGPSEPDSPVAAPFFLLYPGDGGAGFTARPPPQRTWRTPPSPGSPLPFLLLSYPSGGSGGKHQADDQTKLHYLSSVDLREANMTQIPCL